MKRAPSDADLFALADASAWPLVVLTAPSEISSRVTDVLLDSLDGYFDRDEPFAIVFDLSAVEIVPDRMERRRMADYQTLRRAAFARLVRGEANVIRSPLVRAAVTTINWLSPAPHPLTFFSEREAAITWAEARIPKRTARVESSGLIRRDGSAENVRADIVGPHWHVGPR